MKWPEIDQCPSVVLYTGKIVHEPSIVIAYYEKDSRSTVALPLFAIAVLITLVVFSEHFAHNGGWILFPVEVTIASKTYCPCSKGSFGTST